MKIRERKEVALVASGILLGVTLAAPAAGAMLTAQQSGQKIYVDGKPVQIEVYSINGNNYAKIREPDRSPIPRSKIAVLPFLQESPCFSVDFSEYSRFFCAEIAGFLPVLHRVFWLCFVCVF